VAKGKATKAANKAAALQLMGAPAPKKIKRFHKSSRTPAQREAAIARLAAAREARGPSQNVAIAEEVRLLPDTDTFSLKNVRVWLKTNKQLLASMRGMKESKEPAHRASYNAVETYVSNLETYLRTGVYGDNRLGEHATGKVTYVCRAMAYYADGTPKRSVGVFYPDVGEYTKEMAMVDSMKPSKKVSNARR
jgi:hypothetical protein